MFQTQMVETYIGNEVHALRNHNSEREARDYAIQRTSEKRCDIRLLMDGSVIAVYADGAIAKR